MNIRIFATVPAFAALCAAMPACSGAGPESTDPNESNVQAVTSCPTPPWDAAQQRALATLAVNLIKAAGRAAGGHANAVPAYSVLATQRYRYRSPGPGIEFDPGDPLYPYVTNAMKAELAFAQEDSSVASELGDSLYNNWQQTDGRLYPSIAAVPNIAAFKGPQPYTAAVLDQPSDGHMATVTSSAWCGTELIKVDETCVGATSYAPMIAREITDWRSAPPSNFVGKQHIPSTVFNGNLTGGNPYLLVTVNGVRTTWTTNYNFAGSDCTKQPNRTCTGSLELDPVPYAESDAFYDANNNLVGPQPNPFGLANTALYADPAHAGEWATRTVNNTQEWGTFSQAVTLFGTTKYKYVKEM